MFNWLWNKPPWWHYIFGGAEMMGGGIGNIWPSLWWASVPFVLVGATQICFGGWCAFRDRRRGDRRVNNLAIALTVGAAVAAVLWFALNWLDYRRNDIIWMETQYIPITTIHSVPHNAHAIEAFSFHGKSNRQEPIVVRTAFLRSLVGNRETIPITLDGVDGEGAQIQPGITFNAAARFPNDLEEGHGVRGMKPETLWQRFPTFEVVIETTEREHKFTYKEDEVKAFLQRFDDARRGQAPARPTVLPKKPADAR